MGLMKIDFSWNSRVILQVFTGIFRNPMKVQRKIILSKFLEICNHSPVGFNRKQVLAILFFDITGSIGISWKSSLNGMNSNGNRIWIIRGCKNNWIIGFRNGTKDSKATSNFNWWSRFMLNQLFTNICSRLFIFWSLACHYGTVNSLVRKSRIKFWELLIYSISK